MEWMSAIDSSFLHVENDTTPMHIGGVSIFEGPPLPFEDLREMVAGKLDLVPRYRQSRLVTLSPRLNMHTATTNVPGPQQPVQTLGRRMLESYPFVPVVGSIRIVVAIFSYDGGLYFGVTGDYDGAPDIGVLTEGIERGMSDLLVLAAPPPSARRNGGKRASPPLRRAAAR